MQKKVAVLWAILLIIFFIQVVRFVEADLFKIILILAFLFFTFFLYLLYRKSSLYATLISDLRFVGRVVISTVVGVFMISSGLNLLNSSDFALMGQFAIVSGALIWGVGVTYGFFVLKEKMKTKNEVRQVTMS